VPVGLAERLPASRPWPSRGLRVADGCLELWAGVALTTLDLNVFGHQLPLASVQVAGDCFALRFQAQAAASLFVGGEPSLYHKPPGVAQRCLD